VQRNARVERVLYRDKMRAAGEIDALIDDFPHARNVRALVGRVTNDVHRLMRSPFVCVYREAGSTYSPVEQAGRGSYRSTPMIPSSCAFGRSTPRCEPTISALPCQGHRAVFPLVVFGSLTGALYATCRESGEQFDPDELKTLERLAHEPAIALLWIERTPKTATSELDAATS
jgi:GAF domain-containing protein